MDEDRDTTSEGENTPNAGRPEPATGWTDLIEESTRRRAGAALGDLVDSLRGWKTTPRPDPPEPTDASDARETLESAGWVAAGVADLEQVLGLPWWRTGDVGVREVLVQLGRLRTVLDRVEVSAVGEAISRGLPQDDGLSPVDWVAAAEGVGARPGPPPGRPGRHCRERLPRRCHHQRR